MGKNYSYIYKIANKGRRDPKHRKFYVKLLAVSVFLDVIFKKIKIVLKPVSKVSLTLVTSMAVVLLFPCNITDGAVTPYLTLDEKKEAEAFKTNIDKILDQEVALSPCIERDELPWNLILINNNNPLPEDYSYNTKKIRAGYVVDERIYDPLMEMLNAGWNQGLNLMVCSAYRSYDKQVELFDDAYQIGLAMGLGEEGAYDYAAEGYSLPGCSEHQAALAVDIVASYHQSLDTAYANTPEAKWLVEHCAEYGFILRYPKDKTDVTGIKYEAWHFRYVGKEVAEIIMNEGITLEEYLQKYYKDYYNVYYAD